MIRIGQTERSISRPIGFDVRQYRSGAGHSNLTRSDEPHHPSLNRSGPRNEMYALNLRRASPPHPSFQSRAQRACAVVVVVIPPASEFNHPGRSGMWIEQLDHPGHVAMRISDDPMVICAGHFARKERPLCRGMRERRPENKLPRQRLRRHVSWPAPRELPGAGAQSQIKRPIVGAMKLIRPDDHVRLIRAGPKIRRADIGA